MFPPMDCRGKSALAQASNLGVDRSCGSSSGAERRRRCASRRARGGRGRRRRRLGARTTGNDATRAYGIARASSTGARSPSALAVASTATAGPQVINGQFQGTSPEVSALPVLPVPHSPIKAQPHRVAEAGRRAARCEGPGHPEGQGLRADLRADPELRRHLPAVRAAVRAAEQLQLPAARHGRRGRRDPVRPDGEHRLRGLLEDGPGAARRDADQPALGQHRRRVQDAQQRRSGRALRPVGQPLAADAVHRAAHGHRGVRAVHRRLDDGDATGSYYLYEFHFGRHVPRLREARRLAGRLLHVVERVPGRLRPRAARARCAFDRAKMLAGQPARVMYFDESAANPTGGQSSASCRPTSTARRCRPPARRTCSRRSTTPRPSADRRQRRLVSALEVPRRLGEPVQLDASTTASRATRSRSRRSCAAVRLRLRRLRPAAGRHRRSSTSLADRLMFRLELPQLRRPRVAARRTTRVKAGDRTGVRWYELRNPNGDARSIYQQGTYAPADSDHCRAGWARSPRTRRATSRSATARRADTTTRASATPAAWPATRSAA